MNETRTERASNSSSFLFSVSPSLSAAVRICHTRLLDAAKGHDRSELRFVHLGHRGCLDSAGNEGKTRKRKPSLPTFPPRSPTFLLDKMTVDVSGKADRQSEKRKKRRGRKRGQST
ncbi:hypothetical protein TGPRC2_265005 [Toxoplasma gondii TgCatPRC2]|uniref:Uncharacterized protein n=10 Tax=Toxoplasma gondii TaxID=5811 RepID=S7UGU2_TOXGG|nr:hypothetical protein TGME49_265005 [Toxoplasma gondii ME49]EPR57336.1 hypothetical protein TGGT1_265005 [Toxoplasma gondii GT1]KAF4644255.1 hypothetical protein TGRH88_012470 [Toxoplasma gondii]KFG38508.1 hypothetical protein TGDOM2_265005 [Toxoplasma gondii GAB2-2007-GAL-DOM2]KFG42244.1 hypothetical protein TGFOU_265005 [Toxoplasma gondii FOU]KFG58267.1 hypothetical protein TGRUB_265005 [Toxoplasma gondii RUB]KYF45377.1 hypothetical protein TGARI_265005 [Toxoplasma gondii ARI]KYK64766.1 |eukprot:XP_018636314.1 hypothetical protein TGME49_265005 [Toxoplasma gondii ME49]